MEPLVLKKSCDACTHSKVKCSGGYPCERCIQKKVQCFYSPRKRRVKPSKNKKPKQATDADDSSSLPEEEVQSKDTVNTGDVIISRSSFDPSVPLGSLVDWERRSWSVFFTLYKHYGTSCSLHWFNRQLNKMRNYLVRQGNTESLRRLTAWMEALSIDVDGLAAQVEKCRIKCFVERSRLSLQVKGTVRDERRLQPILRQTNDRTPFIKMTTSYSMNLEEDDVRIECNKAFPLIFGITEKAITEQLRWTGGGFLPWGGDILSRLLTQEKDLLAFVQILAIKFNALGPPKELPAVRDVPSCHMFEINIKESANGMKLVPVNALVKCMHREVMTEESSFLEISMEFTPLAPHEHLLNPDRFSLETTQLSIEKPVKPFPTKSNDRIRVPKRTFTDEVGADEDEEYYDDDDETDEFGEEKDSGNTDEDDNESGFLAGSNHSINSGTNSNTVSHEFDHHSSNASRRSSKFTNVSYNGNFDLAYNSTSEVVNSFTNTLRNTHRSSEDEPSASSPTIGIFDRIPSFDTGAAFADDFVNHEPAHFSNTLNAAFAVKDVRADAIGDTGSEFGRLLDDVPLPQLQSPAIAFSDNDAAVFEDFSQELFNGANGPTAQYPSRRPPVTYAEKTSRLNNDLNDMDFFEEQAEWLDGLLNWAGAKELN